MYIVKCKVIENKKEEKKKTTEIFYTKPGVIKIYSEKRKACESWQKKIFIFALKSHNFKLTRIINF